MPIQFPVAPRELDIRQENDLLIIDVDGDYTLEVAQYVEDRSAEMLAEYGYLLHMTNVRKAGPITADARRYVLSKHDRTKMLGATAIIGANFATRTLASMVLRAMASLTKMPVSYGFFNDEAEARAWIDKERIRVKSQLDR